MTLCRKKANITLYFSFIILAVIIIIFGAVTAPLGRESAENLYTSGDRILEMSQAAAADISDHEARDRIAGYINSSRADGLEENIEVSTSLFKYSWLFVLILIAIVLYVASRRSAQLGGFV